MTDDEALLEVWVNHFKELARTRLSKDGSDGQGRSLDELAAHPFTAMEVQGAIIIIEGEKVGRSGWFVQ